MVKLSELVKTIDVAPFHAGDGDALRFRIEILRELDTGKHRGRVFRLETYRLQPTFPLATDGAADVKDDALLYVGDDMFDPDLLQGDSAEEVLGKFQAMFGAVFEKALKS